MLFMMGYMWINETGRPDPKVILLHYDDIVNQSSNYSSLLRSVNDLNYGVISSDQYNSRLD